jgi:hypothetical protein
LPIALLGGCGTVLPPLDEADGAAIDGAGQSPEDVSEEGAPPDAETPDANVDDVDLDGTADDGVSSDATSDVCRTCADAMIDVETPADVASDVRPADARVNGDANVVDADAAVCPTPVNCAVAACNGVSCGAHGQVCKGSACACPGGQTKETTCGDKMDNDCDGLTDCADPDCARLQCGTSTNQRCCGTTCANTETDPANCQGCGLACASGQTCKRISDADGVRGACTCAGTSSLCPKYPATVCRVGNGDGQDNLCACDAVNSGNAGCAEGQVCANVTAANYCHY